ncbi:MAG: PmoA family protein [Sedimentisphaerales bacterium]|nr:PmoA family protein [Sedimentisphaerales bacterium]
MAGQPYHLVETTGSDQKSLAAQIQPGDKPLLCWILEGKTPVGQKRTFELVQGRGPRSGRVQVSKDDKVILVKVGDNNVLQYHHAIVPSPAGQSPLFNRSGFIHPFWSPAGAVMTNIHPQDHYHHIGFWMPWTTTEFEGRPVDFWNLAKGEGTVRFKELLGTENGRVFGRFQVRQEHVNLKAPGGEKVVLNEVWDIKVWNTDGADKGFYLWDFVSTQRCASDSPLHLPAYRYGGIGYRATAQWKEDNSDYLTSEGKNRKNGHGTRAKWCLMHGPTEKDDAGVLFMGHPDNHEFPEPMRIWPEGDVFFNFCPVQENAWTLEPGKDYVFKYRLLVYNGKLDPEAAERAWQDFGNPPAVKVEQ